MSVRIIECRTPSERKKFAHFPYVLYKNNPFWVPPLRKQELEFISPEINPVLRTWETCFWIVEKEGHVVGRTGAMIHHGEQHGTKQCRLSRTEFINDYEVSQLLFRTVEEWARTRGMEVIHGPLGFTNLDHQGVLVEGFDHLPSIASEYHLPYYREHFEAAGFVKEMDWVEFRLTLEKEIPEKAIRISQMIQNRYGLKVIHFKNMRELKAYSAKIFLLLNIAFGSLFSFVPLDEEASDFYTRKYLRMMNPSFVKAVEDKNQNTIAFIVSLPSLSRALQKANGKIFPSGWYHIGKALQKPEAVDLLLTAIHPDWQAQGTLAILITELQKVMLENNVVFVETTGMLETNDKAINNWKNYEHIQHKRKRCYRKSLV